MAAFLSSALSNPALKNKLTSAAMGGLKDKAMGLVQKIVDKYKDDACTNPPVFLDRVIADIKSSPFLPSALRIGIEMHRAQIESEMKTVLAEPEFQTACQTADVRKITDEIFGALQNSGALESTGGYRRKRKTHRRRSHRRSHRRSSKRRSNKH